MCLAEFVTVKNSYPTRKNLCLAFGELDLPTSKFEVRVFVIPSCPSKKSLSKSRGENLLQANTADYLPSKTCLLIFTLHEIWSFLIVASLVSGCVLTLSASTSLHFSAFASTSHWRQAWTPTWGQRIGKTHRLYYTVLYCIDWYWEENEILKYVHNRI